MKRINYGNVYMKLGDCMEIIENPVINSPFEKPKRHFKFDDNGITNEITSGRRISEYFIPIAKPRKSKAQMELLFDNQLTQDRRQDNEFINQIRERVELWRKRNYEGATNTSKQLLHYWTSLDRDPGKRLFFCQIEALETAIYISEVARKYNDTWIEERLRLENEAFNPGIFRIAFKMATGTGKTVVMAMFIAWQTLNRLANPRDNRFTDSFLIITPGITIRDRLRVLLPNDPDNYYRQRDVVNSECLAQLSRARIIITNYHAFKLRELNDASRLTKNILSVNSDNAFVESPEQMVRRVIRELGNRKNIMVINDEAHHCYRRRIQYDEEKLSREDKREAEKRDEEARIWISGIEAIKGKMGVKAVYDLSATPFFLKGSGEREGTLFPWVVSDFSLTDAIESGIVKVPRVPVADDSMIGDQPTYRDLWPHIKDDLPKKGRGTEKLGGEPKLPVALQGALHSLYGNYELYYKEWEANQEARARGLTPPVFIVVCNNTNVSKLVYDYISGWKKTLTEESTILVPGQLPIFNNEKDGRWAANPNTILIDSEQLDSGEGMSNDFKKIAGIQIDEFKREYRTRFSGRDVDKITDEELLREVMNTVGKSSKLGENIKCVVSVSMLTEGWDANTVTHVLGVRAFGTQLLCEQVVGRGLRRTTYSPEELTCSVNGKIISFEGFYPEYAEVYGVPFSFIPTSGSAKPVKKKQTTRVRAITDRADCEISFPRVMGYRYEFSGQELTADFSKNEVKYVLSTANLPTITENAPIIGESSIHNLVDLQHRRIMEVSFRLAMLTLQKYFRDDEDNIKNWFFPQILEITGRWLDECVTFKDNTFVQEFLLIELANAAADRIYLSLLPPQQTGTNTLKPMLRPYDTVGSTRYVDFETSKNVYTTNQAKCHISHVVADTDSWEQKMAQVLESMSEVRFYVKNHNLGFTIPYILNGEERNYIPDFIAIIDQKGGNLNLIVEVSGQNRPDKAIKVATARDLWIPAINNHGGFGKWAFIEIKDPWNAVKIIRDFLDSLQEEEVTTYGI